jgi:hypothetical protein
LKAFVRRHVANGLVFPKNKQVELMQDPVVL